MGMSPPDSNGDSDPAAPGEGRRVREPEETLRREQAERQRLEQAREEAKELVHDLNNALSIITTFAASLDEEIAKDHPLRESVDEIVRAAKRAGTITRKLSDLHRGKGDPPDQGRT